MQDICRARSILYLHLLQPTLHDEGSKKLTPNEIEHGAANLAWIDGVHAGYPLLRKMGERMKAEGVNFVDATQIFADEAGEVYLDSCHFEQVGNRILAKSIGDELLARWDQVK